MYEQHLCHIYIVWNGLRICIYIIHNHVGMAYNGEKWFIRGLYFFLMSQTKIGSWLWLPARVKPMDVKGIYGVVLENGWVIGYAGIYWAYAGHILLNKENFVGEGMGICECVSLKK